jgi:hypothetical protein
MLMLLPALLLAGQSATVQHAKPSEPVVQVGLSQLPSSYLA